MEPVGIVAYSGEQCGAGVRPDSLDLEQIRCGLARQAFDLDIEGGDLFGKVLVPHGERLQGQLAGRLQRSYRSWSKADRSACQLGDRQPAQAFAQVVGRGDDDRVQLVGSLGARLHRRSAGYAQHAEHLHRTVLGLGLAQDRSGLYRARSGLGVERIGLARQPASPPAGADHFDDVDVLAAQVASQASAVGTSALDAELVDNTQAASLLQHAPVSVTAGRDVDGIQLATELIQRGGDMGVQVGVHPDRDHDLARPADFDLIHVTSCADDDLTTSPTKAARARLRWESSSPYEATARPAGDAWWCPPCGRRVAKQHRMPAVGLAVATVGAGGVVHGAAGEVEKVLAVVEQQGDQQGAGVQIDCPSN